MVNARNILLWIIGIIFLMSVALNVYHFATESSSSAITSDTTRVTVYDTIPFIKPKPKDSVVVRYVTEVVSVVDTTETVTDSIKVGTDCTLFDDIEVEIPITQKVYEDSTYKAYVSGYKPSLDSLIMRMPNTTTTIVKTDERSRWSLSVSVGYGLTLNKQPTFAPVASVNLSYNIYTFPKLRKKFKEKRKQITY